LNELEKSDATTSETLILSAMMLESFRKRTAKQFPNLDHDGVIREMYRALYRIEEAENRVSKSWLHLMQKIKITEDIQ
jgi:hypothetical protein